MIGYRLFVAVVPQRVFYNCLKNGSTGHVIVIYATSLPCTGFKHSKIIVSCLPFLANLLVFFFVWRQPTGIKNKQIISKIAKREMLCSFNQ